jgi:hypothetical protein
MSDTIHFRSKEFQLFIDEPLRKFACQSVDYFLEKNTPVKHNQLKAIPSAIAGGKFAALQRLIESQRQKNTKQDNKSFWEFLHQNLIQTQQVTEYSLYHFLRKQPFIASQLSDESAAETRVQRKKMKKENNKIIDPYMEQLISIFFEHFNCHYFYQTQGLL